MVLSAKHLGKSRWFHEKITKNLSHTKHTFRFPRVLAVNNGTDPKSEKPIRSAIKFATKALKMCDDVRQLQRKL